MIRIMLVDDESNVLAALSRVLRRDWGDKAQIEGYSNPVQALEDAACEQFDVVISDFRMPKMDGIAFLSNFRDLQPATSRIILSGTADFDVLMVAINDVGIFRFIPKPWDDDEVIKTVHAAVDATRDARELARLNGAPAEAVETVVREHGEMRRLEQMEPGITRVRWGPNGEVLLDGE